VGKSSLLNAVVGQRGLARVSATPGKTQFVNVYALPGFYLVDLPGYGWARAAKRDRAAYRTLVQTYLRQRDTLRGVVWLLDIRHAPSVHDREMQELLAESGRPVLTVLTKADKFPVGKRRAAIAARAAELGMAADELHPTSSTGGMGIADLGESILAAVAGARQPVSGEP